MFEYPNEDSFCENSNLGFQRFIFQWLIVRRDAMTLFFKSDYARVTSGFYFVDSSFKGLQNSFIVASCYASEVNSGSLSISYDVFCVV